MFAFIVAVLTACVSGYWIGQRVIAFYLRKRLDPLGKAVLVTGCDTGFGNALASRLHSLGFTVFAGCLDSKCEGALKLVEGAKRVEREEGRSKRPRMKVIQMDICNDNEVTESVRTISSLLPKDTGIHNNCYPTLIVCAFPFKRTQL